MRHIRHALTVFAILLPAVTLHAGEPANDDPHVQLITWGAKVGFAATGSYLTNAVIDGHKLTEYTQDTQVGNFMTLQFRMNSKKLLIQSGIGLSFNKSAFFVDKNSWDPDNETIDELSCSYSMKSVIIPIQVGFHLVNRPPYCMSVFTGPRLRYTPSKYYTSEIANLDPYQFSESPSDLVMSWTMGLSVQIGRTFLDFEYDATINNVNGPLHETSGADPAPEYSIDRRVGIISFSYGIMF